MDGENLFLVIARDIASRKFAENLLINNKAVLEVQVEERTRHLRQEITERKYMEEAIKEQ